MALTATLVKRHQTGMGLVGKFAIVAAGNYATGGMDLDFAPVIGYTNRQPDFVQIQGMAGYTYQYDYASKKVLMFQSPQPAGTITQPTFTVKNGTIGSNMTIGLTADATTANVVGGTGITTDRTLTTTSPVAAPTFTGGAAAALGQLAATTLPAGVTGDTIVALVHWISTPSLNI
jgi:hypothetical protein